MILSNDNLQAMISGSIVGTLWPYDCRSTEDIESYLRGLVAELSRSTLLEVESDFIHYGSGFASYVHVFCFKRDGKSTVRERDTDQTDGIAVYLSRLAPVAAYGPEQRTKSYRRGWFGLRKVVGKSFGNLEAESQIDKDVAALADDQARFRLSESMAFLEGMTQQMASTVIYGSTAANPDRFTGLAPRYNSVSTATALKPGFLASMRMP